MTTETDATIMQLLKDIAERLSALEARTAALANADFGFLQAAALRTIADAKEAREFQRRTDIKLEVIYGSMATGPEIKKLREEASRSIDHETELDLRISAIETRLGIKNPLLT